MANSIDEAVVDANVIMGLRIQTERQQSGMFPSVGEYAALYGINEERVQKAAGNVLLMHPGPVNRGVEMSSASVDCKSSVILEQVTNGVAVRMAVLDMLK
ncbi:hypothetical protein AGMMS4956_20330 [Bacteroidia bacterium]|nr:hypothetical protein AGMMS4956_20330 [Bacteroidia bacterium]